MDTNALLDERITNCRARYAEQPESGVFVMLADLLRQRGDYEEALGILADGVIHRPESVAALVVLGRTLLEADRAEDARTALQRVLDLDRDNLVGLRLLAEDCRSRADWSAAVPYLERLAVLDPDEKRWPAALEEARSFRDAPAQEEGETGAEAEAGFATLTLVDIYIAQGYHDRAVAALEQMLEANPERAEVRERLATLKGSDALPPLPVEAAPEVEEPEPVPEAEPAFEVDAEPVGETKPVLEQVMDPVMEAEQSVESETVAEAETEAETAPDILDDTEQKTGDSRDDRDVRKQQFADWLNSLKSDGGGTP